MSVQFVDLEPPVDDFRSAVLQGLAASPKSLPPKFFYDAEGSRLFDQICELPEYYPTRTEMALMKHCGADIARVAGRGRSVVEFGAGGSQKAALLLSALNQPAGYTAIDISRTAVEATMTGLQSGLGDPLDLVGICADFMQPLDPGQGIIAEGQRLCFFPGSTIGNFEPTDAITFLAQARKVARDDGAMLIGVDLEKDVNVLEAAYDDAAGVTAAFNLNVLHRMERDLNAALRVNDFEHLAYFNQDKKRIEMHLKAVRDTDIIVEDQCFNLSSNETIHTENSHKYTPERFGALAAQAGWQIGHIRTDPRDYFALLWLEPAP